MFDDALTDLARLHSGKVRALLAKRFNDVSLADDAVGEALAEAAKRWPVDGIPDNPAGWLHQVARRKALDNLRRVKAEDGRVSRFGAEVVEQALPADRGETLLVDDPQHEPGDEQLRLMLLCCHDALATEAQVALTLRLVAGLTTEEIAAAFLVPTATMAQRVTRAKKKIRAAAIPLSLPANLDDRLKSIHSVLYLIFNQGYLGRGESEQSHAPDLCAEAIRLAAAIVGLAPQSAESHGLLALMVFSHARRDARFDEAGIVLLADQDRSAWHLEEIRQANTAMSVAIGLMRPGPYQLQALVASHHANAREAQDVDWGQIVKLYDQLVAVDSSPVVALNRAAALGEADGPLAGLRAVEAIQDLGRYYLWHSTRAEQFMRLDDLSSANQSFEVALSLTKNPAERLHLRRRLAASS